MKVETANGKVIAKPVKTTRGEIEEFNRATWNYMKKQLNLTEAQLIKMQVARCPAKVKGMGARLVRYFDRDIAQGKGLIIKDYMSLNEHPELILYEGYQVLGKGGEINIKKWDGVETSLLEEKIKKGDITEVGVILEKTTTQKWLGGFGKFIMMGGFIVILVVIVGLVLGISLALQNC